MERTFISILVLILLFLDTSCARQLYLYSNDPEGSRRLAAAGYGIAFIAGNSGMTVTPLDGSGEVRYSLRGPWHGFARTTSDGRKIMQCAKSGMQVYDLSADSFYSFRGPVACAISQADLTKDGKRLAWLTVGSDGSEQLGILNLGDSVFSATLLRIAPTASYNTFAWGADGESIVYEADGKIAIYSLQSKRTKVVGLGHNPTWSGDGAWIGYQSMAGDPTFYHVADSRELHPLQSRKMKWALHFSPDSKYVFFSESSPGTSLNNLRQMSDKSLIFCNVPQFKEVARYMTWDDQDDHYFMWIRLDREIRLPKSPAQ